MGRTSVYVLSYNRPELLACTLAGLCGFNGGPPHGRQASPPDGGRASFPIHVIDDGSSDPRVMPLLARYKLAGLIESVEQVKHGTPCPPGFIRRRMIDRFLENGAEQLVQVEADILIGPGQVKALVNAYAGAKAYLGDLHFLNTMHHTWCKKRVNVSALLEVIACGPYRIAITLGGSEAFWTSDRRSLQQAVDAKMLPAERPDLEAWLGRLHGASLYQPEINCQHIGAGRCSLLYGEFPAVYTLYRQDNERSKDDGSIRQPYPDYPLSWPQFEQEMLQSALRLYEWLRGKSPAPLPEFPA